MPTTRRVISATALSGALLVLLCGIAFATIPNGGVIYGCYAKSGGALRVIDRSVTNCKASETSLDWNVQGPAGAAGPPGPQGVPGMSGREVVVGSELMLDPNEFGSAEAVCPAGKSTTGGGFLADKAPIHVVETGPYASSELADRWFVYGHNMSGELTGRLRAYAVCVSTP
jgi:hypothetical protein